jgi:hypothetical protein
LGTGRFGTLAGGFTGGLGAIILGLGNHPIGKQLFCTLALQLGHFGLDYLSTGGIAAGFHIQPSNPGINGSQQLAFGYPLSSLHMVFQHHPTAISSHLNRLDGDQAAGKLQIDRHYCFLQRHGYWKRQNASFQQ